jgi:hypothetical protein
LSAAASESASQATAPGASALPPIASRRSAFGVGVAFSLSATLAFASLLAPGRLALSAWQANLGRDRWQTFASGFAHDVFDTALFFGTIVTLPLLFPAALRERRGWPFALFAAAPIVAIALGFTSSCFAEFSMQRGTFPTWFDLQGGVKDTSFITNALQVFLHGRHAQPIALGCALAAGFAAVSRFALAHAARVSKVAHDAVVAGAACASFAVATFAGLPNFPYHGWFPALGDGDVTGAPFHTFFMPISQDVTNIRFGVMGIVERAEFERELEKPGAAMLGYGPIGDPAPTSCAEHPLRRPFPSEEQGATDLTRSFVRLSDVLFDTPRPPKRLVHVVLESYRGDDLHALNPRAPAALAPFTNALIEGAVARARPDLAAPIMLQAGCRSSQGFSSHMCGLGMVGFNISATRDLGALPVRCLPDVFTDAGIDTHYVYGAEVSFDGVDDFLRLHGVRSVHGETAMPPGLPRGGWGISDLAMLEQLLGLLRSTPPAPFSWWVMSTLSNHTPFEAPADTPDEAYARVSAATEAHSVGAEERDRLVTTAYTDVFLERAFARLDALPDAAETIVLTNADHSTADTFLWDEDAGKRLRPKSQIPFVLHLPDAMISAHRDPAALRAALDEAQRALAAGPVSQNDIATLTLALLERSPPVAALPQGARWHTLGGQRTSPHWSAPTRAGAAVIGLNAIGEFFAADSRGEALGPIVQVETIASPEDVDRDHTEVRPTAAVFGHLLRDWAKRCPAPGSIRAAGPP